METKRKPTLTVGRVMVSNRVNLAVEVVGYPTEYVDVDYLSPVVVEEALYNGLTQTIVDAAALPKVDGMPASPAAKHAAVMARLATLRAGFWTSGGVIYSAFARVTGMEYAAARAKFDSLTEEQQKAVRATRRIQDAIADLRGVAGSEVGDSILDDLS